MKNVAFQLAKQNQEDAVLGEALRLRRTVTDGSADPSTGSGMSIPLLLCIAKFRHYFWIYDMNEGLSDGVSYLVSELLSEWVSDVYQCLFLDIVP